MLPTKFEVSISTHYEDVNGDTKVANGVVLSHSTSLEITPFD